jgi:hypothetical protein
VSMVYRGIIMVVCVGLMGLSAMAQVQPKTSDPKPKLTKRISSRVMKLVKQNQGDTIVDQKSEEDFIQFQGKIVRKIIVNHVGFERNINDTTRYRVVNTVTRVANSLHTDTKEKVIRNNLFFRTNRPLDPYKLADNERYLRDLPFVLDARIVVKPVRGNRDQVDVLVYTRDVFSLGGSASVRSNGGRYRLYDANLSGWGQRTEYSGIFGADRSPAFGHQFLYSKNSIAGSFIQATVSYSELNTGASLGLENESALYLKLDRPLVSPYTRWAGGMELSRNWSENVNGVAEATFRSYTYYVKDLWVGYNIGIKNKVENRNRYFVGVRAFGQSFSHQPQQPEERWNKLYNNEQFILGSFTFYNQNFYRTKYVYGFGRTEDVPYGIRASINFGRTVQIDTIRPYAGAELEHSVFRKSGDFHQSSVRVGGYYYDGRLQDVVLLASTSVFSRLMFFKGLKIRQSFGASYTNILNQKLNLPLRIDNEFGLERLRNDSITGTQRLKIGIETVVYIRPKLLGFNFAPFGFIDAVMIAPKREVLIKQKPYYALGGGLRTRNENLIFGTIEMRMFYFPRVPEDLSKFRITLSSNLRVKYSSSFVKAPSLVPYN